MFEVHFDYPRRCVHTVFHDADNYSVKLTAPLDNPDSASCIVQVFDPVGNTILTEEFFAMFLGEGNVLPALVGFIARARR